jgi:ABC-type sugar transport system ATPase subunit
MLIILEGPDGAGKTTLLNTLRDKLPFYAGFIRTNSKARTLGELIHMGVDLIDLGAPINKPPFIVDRHPFISEWVYGPILRGDRLFPYNLEKVYDRYLNPIEALIVYCRPDNLTVYQNVQRVDQRIGIRREIQQIIQSYDATMLELKSLGADIVEYDYTQGKGPAKLIDLIVKYKEEVDG